MRDYAIDELAYQKVFPRKEDRNKIIFALNCCDKIEPISRNHTSTKPSPEQMKNITQKINSVSNIFNMNIDNIIPYSAETGWNMNNLAERIVLATLMSGDLILTSNINDAVSISKKVMSEVLAKNPEISNIFKIW